MMDTSSESNISAPHILVIDDDTRLRKLLQKFLQGHGYRITLAASAAEARARMQGLAFDLTVLDVMMPGESGLSLTQFLRAQTAMPILLLSARSETPARIAGLEAGADDYLGKPFEPKELLLRIQALLRRANPILDVAPKTLSLGRWELDLERGDLRQGETIIRLAPGELGLLRLLAAQPGVPLSRTVLSEQTGAAQERTIDVQITRLRRKFEEDPRTPRYLQTIRGQGYVLWPD